MSPSFLHEEQQKDYRAPHRDLGRRNETSISEVTVTRPSRKEAKARRSGTGRMLQNWRADRGRWLADIAIEVDVSSSQHQQARGLRAPGVPEVWGWEPASREIVIHRQANDGYERGIVEARWCQISDVALPCAVRAPWGEPYRRLGRAYREALRRE